MAMATDATLKKKRISKKNKSAWRKTDITDVEQFLEDQRQEERIGTFAHKKDEDLFVVEQTPSLPTPSPAVLSVRQKRKLDALKPMRTYQSLENTSKVQDPIAKRNHVKQKKNGRNIEEEIRNPTKPRHHQANSDRERYYQQLEQKAQAKASRRSALDDIDKDLWVEEDFRDKVPGLKDEKGWISRDLAVHIAGNIGRKVVKTHASLHHNTTKAKKFEAPHPGMSYHPSLAAHTDLLSLVTEREEGIIKKEQHLKRVTTSMFSKVTPEERDQRRLMEMSDGITDPAEQVCEVDEEQADGDSNAYETVNAPVLNKKKSKQARNKELRQKELQRLTEAKRALKKQTADLNRIKSIRAELNVEDEELNVLKKRRKATAERKKSEPKRLGRHKFEEPDLDVNMPEDLAGNLRNVKTESNLLTDRFKLLQKRNMLPTTVAVSRKKSKVKRFPRNSHKDPGVSYQDLRDKRKAAAAAANASKDTIKI